MASHSSYGGSRWARTIHYYTADGRIGQTWCRFEAPTAEIKRLDEAGRRWGLTRE